MHACSLLFLVPVVCGMQMFLLHLRLGKIMSFYFVEHRCICCINGVSVKAVVAMCKPTLGVDDTVHI